MKMPNRDAVGIGVMEAPRGTLYHKVSVGADGLVKEGEVIVPTGQNQVNIERDVGDIVGRRFPRTAQGKDQIRNREAHPRVRSVHELRGALPESEVGQGLNSARRGQDVLCLRTRPKSIRLHDILFKGKRRHIRLDRTRRLV